MLSQPFFISQKRGYLYDENAPDVIRTRGGLVNSDAIDTAAKTD